MSRLATAWRGTLSRCPAGLGLVLVWTSSAWIAFNPGRSLVPAAALFVSAFVLSRLSARKARMFQAAVVFLGFWSLAAWILGSPGRGGFRPETLAAWMFLGLHLFMVWSPASLGGAVRRLAGPLAGQRRAALLGLSLMALAKAAPAVIADAVSAGRSLRRVSGLPFRRRMALWGKTTVRLTMKRSAGLGRTLAKRQGDLG
ncbi:MAG: hypothetical protein LBT40_02425 [Deltaproteobacteria bacterium]|nr:hypothetical protein [Deltaproteobacteria bacterium]